MIYTVNEYVTEKLLSLPETGMGYQLVSARLLLDSYFTKPYVVYNAQVFLDLDNTFLQSKRNLSEAVKYQSANFSLARLRIPRLNIASDTISLLQKNEAYKLVGVRESGSSLRLYADNQHQSKGRHSGGKAARDNPLQYADGKEVFVRLSAFEDDIRIDAKNKCLKQGSFATTLNDYEDCVHYSDDPIDRYALPQEQQIKYAFHIQPAEKKDIFQRGIVQPANHMQGAALRRSSVMELHRIHIWG